MPRRIPPRGGFPAVGEDTARHIRALIRDAQRALRNEGLAIGPLDENTVNVLLKESMAAIMLWVSRGPVQWVTVSEQQRTPDQRIVQPDLMFYLTRTSPIACVECKWMWRPRGQHPNAHEYVQAGMASFDLCGKYRGLAPLSGMLGYVAASSQQHPAVMAINRLAFERWGEPGRMIVSRDDGGTDLYRSDHPRLWHLVLDFALNRPIGASGPEPSPPPSFRREGGP